jgi:hypothetical protein
LKGSANGHLAGGEAMPEESDVDKVLRQAGELRRSLSKPWTAPIILFALWTVRKRAGLLTAVMSVAALLVTGWIKINT